MRVILKKKKHVIHCCEVLSVQDAFCKFLDPNQNDVVADDVEIGRMLLEFLAEFPHPNADFVHLIIPHVCRWEAAVTFEVIFL